MPDVLLSNDDVTVLGPPSIIDLSVDIGPKGDTGSQIYAGMGNPNAIEIGQEPNLNDLYINAAPGTDYGYLYQYVSEVGGDTWVQVLKISPTIYSNIVDLTFTSGEAEFIVPVSNILTVTGTPPTSSDFNIQYTFENASPISASITVPELVAPGTDLVVNFKAIRYSTESGPAEWVDLDGEVSVHIFISMVSS